METPLLSDAMAAMNQMLGGSFWLYVLIPLVLSFGLRVARIALTGEEFIPTDDEVMAYVAVEEDDEATDDPVEYEDDDDDEEDDDDYLTCAYCGTDNPYGARACSSCGAPARKAFR